MMELTFPFRLSIALVTRNRPHWLRQCLESWRSQDLQPFEIIVSDDSDDSVQPEIQRIAAEFECLWIPGPRRGLYANRNQAFTASHGSHVMSADDDHTHPPGFVRTIVNAVELDPEAIWTVSERSPDYPEAALLIPGELRSNGTVGPLEVATCSAAIACGSSVYPRKVFVLGLRCDETYAFGGLWYLWGHQLRRAGFRIRHSADTFVWHHTESSAPRYNDFVWMEAQHECNLYVHAVHALRISRNPVALLRACYTATRLLTFGGRIHGQGHKIRLRPRCIIRAFTQALRNKSL